MDDVSNLQVQCHLLPNVIIPNQDDHTYLIYLCHIIHPSFKMISYLIHFIPSLVMIDLRIRTHVSGLGREGYSARFSAIDNRLIWFPPEKVNKVSLTLKLTARRRPFPSRYILIIYK